MSQLYLLKNGSIGHFSEAYKERAVDEMKKMPKPALKLYVEKLLSTYSEFGTDNDELERACNILNLNNASLDDLKKSIELIVNVEYKRRFYGESRIREATKKVMKEYGRISL